MKVGELFHSSMANRHIPNERANNSCENAETDDDFFHDNFTDLIESLPWDDVEEVDIDDDDEFEQGKEQYQDVVDDMTESCCSVCEDNSKDLKADDGHSFDSFDDNLQDSADESISSRQPTTKENSMMMTCPKCSHEFDDSESVCPCCHWSPRTRLLLVGSSGRRSFGGRFSVGRTLLRSICGEEDARFADSADQFVLELSEDQKWSVLPGTGKNPTFLNGKRIVSQTALNTNDILSIGLYRARMSVSID